PFGQGFEPAVDVFAQLLAGEAAALEARQLRQHGDHGLFGQVFVDEAGDLLRQAVGPAIAAFREEVADGGHERVVFAPEQAEAQDLTALPQFFAVISRGRSGQAAESVKDAAQIQAAVEAERTAAVRLALQDVGDRQLAAGLFDQLREHARVALEGAPVELQLDEQLEILPLGAGEKAFEHLLVGLRPDAGLVGHRVVITVRLAEDLERLLQLYARLGHQQFVRLAEARGERPALAVNLLFAGGLGREQVISDVDECGQPDEKAGERLHLQPGLFERGDVEPEQVENSRQAGFNRERVFQDALDDDGDALVAADAQADGVPGHHGHEVRRDPLEAFLQALVAPVFEPLGERVTHLLARVGRDQRRQVLT